MNAKKQILDVGLSRLIVAVLLFAGAVVGLPYWQHKTENSFLNNFIEKMGEWTPNHQIHCLVLGVMYAALFLGSGMLLWWWASSGKKKSLWKFRSFRLLTFSLIIAIVMLPIERTHAGTTTKNVMVTAKVMANGEVIIENLPPELSPAQQEEVRRQITEQARQFVKENVGEAQLSIIGCIVLLFVLVLIAIGGIWVYVQVCRSCDKIDQKKKKQAEDAEGDQLVQRPLNGDTNFTVYAAFFVTGTTSPYETLPECGDCKPVGVLQKDGKTSLYIPNKVIPPENLLFRHGLTNGITFTKNGLPTTNSPISFQDRVLTISFPGKTNRMVTVTTSTTPDDPYGTVLSTVSLPADAVFKHVDAVTERGPSGFWKTTPVPEHSY